MSTRPSVKATPDVSREANPPTLADCTESTKRDFVSVLSRALLQKGLDEQILLALYQTKADGVAIALRQGENAVCRASLGSAPDVGVVVEPRQGICGQCIATRKSILVNDLSGEVRSTIAVPIFADSKVEGLVAVFSLHQGAFDQSHLIQLSAIARDIGSRLSPPEPIHLVKDDQALPLLPAEDTPAPESEELDSANVSRSLDAVSGNWQSKQLAILDQVTAASLGASLLLTEQAEESDVPEIQCQLNFSGYANPELAEPPPMLEEEHSPKRIFKWDIVALVLAVLVAVITLGIWLHNRNSKPYVSTGLLSSPAGIHLRILGPLPS